MSTATLVLASGNGYPIAPEGVAVMLREYRVTEAKGNGSQTRFVLTPYRPAFANERIAIIANNHSESHGLLVEAREREVKAERLLTLGLKGKLTRKEREEYDTLLAEQYERIRELDATEQAFEHMR